MRGNKGTGISNSMSRKWAYQNYTWTDERKQTVLANLPEHKMAASGQRGRFYDIGTRRPWDEASLSHLFDQMEDGATALEIAWLTRRALEDVQVILRLTRWMMTQVNLDDLGFEFEGSMIADVL